MRAMKRLALAVSIIAFIVFASAASSFAVDSFKRGNPAFGDYMMKLQSRIKRHWQPPRLQEGKVAILQFRIHRGGDITNVAVLTPSGDPATDRASILAVLRLAPAPALPAGAPDAMDIQFKFNNSAFSFSPHPVVVASGSSPTGLPLWEAKVLTDQGDYPGALIKLRSAFAIESNPIGVGQLEATSKVIAEKLPPEKAIALLRKAMFIDSQDALVRQLLEESMKKQTQDPNSAELRLTLARTARDAGDEESAVAEYRECYRLSHDSRVMDELARETQRVAASDLLDRWNRQLARIDNAENHTGVAYAYEIAGDSKRAEKEYQLALQRDPTYEMAKHQLSGLKASAEPEYKDFDVADLKVVQPQPEPADETSDASTDATAGGGSNAAANSNISVDVLNNEGVKLLYEGKLDDAIAVFKEVLKKQPSYKLAKDNLAIAYNNHAVGQQVENAIKFLRQSIFYKNDPRSQANLDSCLTSTGVNPKSFAARVKLAQACEQNKDYQGAIVEYQRALSLKNDPQIKEALSKCWKLAGP